MTRKAIIRRELKKSQIHNRCKNKRESLLEELRQLQINHEDNYEAIQELYVKLRAMPRDSSPTRLRRRCQMTGRPRGNFRKVGLCRNKFREYAMMGYIPGIVKSSF